LRNFHENFELSISDGQKMLQGWLGAGARLTHTERLNGGACSAVYGLRFDRPPYDAVAKIYPNKDESFERERRVTQYVADYTSFPAPRVYHEDSSRGSLPFAFILLGRLEGVNLAEAKLSAMDRVRIDHQLAEALLELHSHRRELFSDVLESGGKARWSDVMLPRLADLRKDMQTRLPPEMLARLDQALALAPAAFADQGPPTLVHGDVWATNIMVRPGADGWELSGLVDWVSASYADVEHELAYLESWGTVTAEFFRRYCQGQPLRPGYEFRRLFYWLATYMLHVHLFGDEHYTRLVDRTVRKIIA
jgi:fructosamine-3-kinase